MPVLDWLGKVKVINHHLAAPFHFLDKKSSVFDTPKPKQLIERILRLATDKDSLILDSFAGSGTKVHAVINLNAQDGGNRRFILIELMNYAESITAERVKCVGGLQLLRRHLHVERKFSGRTQNHV